MEEFTNEVVKNCTKEQLMPISKINCWGKILEGSIINTDGCQSIKLAYDGLILNGYTHHGTVASLIIFYFICHFWYKFYLFLA